MKPFALQVSEPVQIIPGIVINPDGKPNGLQLAIGNNAFVGSVDAEGEPSVCTPMYSQGEGFPHLQQPNSRLPDRHPSAAATCLILPHCPPLLQLPAPMLRCLSMSILATLHSTSLPVSRCLPWLICLLICLLNCASSPGASKPIAFCNLPISSCSQLLCRLWTSGELFS